MIKSSFYSVFICLFLACSAPNEPSYVQIIQSKRDYIELGFKGPNSPLKNKDKESFKGLSYFKIDSNFRVKAKVKWILDSKPVRLIEDTTIGSLYYLSTSLTFMIGDVICELNGYSRSLKNKTEIFVPFYDLTTREETYSGGRFLEVPITDNDLVTLDFNLAYNPYCAYNLSYTCAVPPFANDLKVYIRAGEKKPSFLQH